MSKTNEFTFLSTESQQNNKCSSAALDILTCIDNRLWDEHPKLIYLHPEFYKMETKLLKLKFVCNNDELLNKKVEKINNDINKNGVVIAVYDNKSFFLENLYKKLTFDKKIYFYFTNLFR